ncbi:MAG: branched-chain amino acid ABC transporter permease [Pirellulales bacterium]
MKAPRWLLGWGAAAAIFAVLPLVASANLTADVSNLFVFGVLALGLNVVVGYTGLLHLGIAAFFGIGAYLCGILTVNVYPFQLGYLPTLIFAAAGAAVMGAVLAAPALRLRGDYLALVTLGFGEVVKVMLRNFEEITAGTRTLGPLPTLQPSENMAGMLPAMDEVRMHHYLFYYLALVILAAVIGLLHVLERSRLGRAWVAVREDELAAQCMGINAARVKNAAMVLSAGLAGLAGCLYAMRLTNTSDPNAYDFNRSVVVLCCLILGGLGSIRGALVGVLLLIGYDSILVPLIDQWVQDAGLADRFGGVLQISRWNLMLFGLALVLMMRFRPAGLLPSTRLRHELGRSGSNGASGTA